MLDCWTALMSVPGFFFSFSAVRDPVTYTTYSESSSCSLYCQLSFSPAVSLVFQHFCIGKILETLSFCKGFVILESLCNLIQSVTERGLSTFALDGFCGVCDNLHNRTHTFTFSFVATESLLTIPKGFSHKAFSC